MPAVEPAVVARALYDSLQATLKDQGADDQFDQVVQAFVDLVRGTGPRDAEVTSALPLESAHENAIVQQLRGKYGPALDIKFTVDPVILGGLIVRVGDRVLDESVRRRLAEVQQRMLAS